ncbi:MAG: protein phosphatase 2C domain-containing protein [Saprospiraceae bacterium]|nr:protein phosphatase 2C domain-containing protein [Saprospiraceae bacterium]
MYIHQITCRGKQHEHYCEDYTIYNRIGQNRLLLAVLDGCTNGSQSWFASALTGKILRKIAYQHFYLEYAQKMSLSLNMLLEAVVKEVFQKLQQFKSQLLLEKYDLLSTLLLAIVDHTEQQTKVIAIGDGLLLTDNEQIVIEQNNQPDYLGYHLEESFESWFSKQNQLFSFSGFENFCLSTDGIFSFGNISPGLTANKTDDEVIYYLLKDKSDLENERYFHKKLRILSQQFCLTANDDLGIIRLQMPTT